MADLSKYRVQDSGLAKYRMPDIPQPDIPRRETAAPIRPMETAVQSTLPTILRPRPPRPPILATIGPDRPAQAVLDLGEAIEAPPMQPTPQLPLTTGVFGPEKLLERRLTIGAGEISPLESILRKGREFGYGVVGGATLAGEPPVFVGPSGVQEGPRRTEKPFLGILPTTPYDIGEFAGALVPITAVARIVKIAGRKAVPDILQWALRHSKFANVFKNVVAEGTTGTAYDAARQLVEEGKVDPGRALGTGAVFSLLGQAGRAIGAGARAVRGTERKAAEALKAERATKRLETRREELRLGKIVKEAEEALQRQKEAKVQEKRPEVTPKPVPPVAKKEAIVSERVAGEGRYKVSEGESFVNTEVINDGKTLLIHSAWTPPKLRRQGVYTKLLRKVIAKAKKDNPNLEYIEGSAISKEAAAAARKWKTTEELPWKGTDPLFRTKISEITKLPVPEITPKMKSKLERAKVVPKAVEPPKPPPIKPPIEKPVTKAPEQEFQGFSKREIVEHREAANLEKLDPVVRKTHVESLNEARKSGYDKKAVEIARDINDSKRIPSHEEVGAMGVRTIELRKQFAESNELVKKLYEKGDKIGAAIEIKSGEIIRKNLDDISQALDKSGTEAGRSLSIRAAKIIPENMGLADAINYVTRGKRGTLKPKERARLDREISARVKAEKKLEEYRATEEQLLVQREEEIAKHVIAMEKVRAGSKRKMERVKAKSQSTIDDATAKLKKMGFAIHDITGLAPEAAFQIGRIATAHIRSGGASTLEGLTQYMRTKMPGITPADVRHALRAKDPAYKKRQKTEVQERIDNVKAEAKIIDDFITEKPTVRTINTMRKGFREIKQRVQRSAETGEQLQNQLDKIDQLWDQLNNKYRMIRKKRAVPSDELKALQQKARDLRREIKIEDNLADLRQQRRRGEYKIKPPPVRRRVSSRLERAEVELKLERNKVQATISDISRRWNAKEIYSETVNFLRTAKASADISAVGRQAAWLSYRRPGLAARTFGRSLKAMFSKYEAAKIHNEIERHPLHYRRVQSKLHISEPGGRVSQREELFMSNLAEKVPGIGQIVKASDRHMTTYMNLIRVGAFDQFMRKFPNATREELTVWANYVNKASGRGDLGDLAGAANKLALLFFAPRFAFSRWQTPYTPFMKGARQNKRAQREMFKDMAANAGFYTTVLTLASLGGATVGDDPRESDFGKIIIGDVHIDIYSGMQQPYRGLIQAMTSMYDKGAAMRAGREIYKSGDFDPWRFIDKFTQYKLAPTSGLIRSAFTGKDPIGRPIEFGPGLAVETFMPIWMSGFYDAYKEEHAGKKGAMEEEGFAAVMDFIGVSASRYQPSIKKYKQQIIDQINDGNIDRAREMIIERNRIIANENKDIKKSNEGKAAEDKKRLKPKLKSIGWYKSEAKKK